MIRLARRLHVRRRRFHNVCNTAYTNDIVDDFLYWGTIYAAKKYGGNGRPKPPSKTVKDIATETHCTVLKHTKYRQHWKTFGGSQRATVVSMQQAAQQLWHRTQPGGLSAWYLSMYPPQRGNGRLGFYGYDLQISAVQPTCSQSRQMKAA